MNRITNTLIRLYNIAIWTFRALGMLVAIYLIIMAVHVALHSGLMNGDRALAVLLTAGAAILAVASWQPVKKDQ
jgi:hypothetical protein